MDTPYTPRHFRLALAALLGVLGGGTLAFALALNESALEAFYRSTVTVSLTGIDTKPQAVGGEVITIVLILAGMAIYGYLASSVVEWTAHGVLTGAMTERRRRRMIERTTDHVPHLRVRPGRPCPGARRLFGLRRRRSTWATC